MELSIVVECFRDAEVTMLEGAHRRLIQDPGRLPLNHQNVCFWWLMAASDKASSGVELTHDGHSFWYDHLAMLRSKYHKTRSDNLL